MGLLGGNSSPIPPATMPAAIIASPIVLNTPIIANLCRIANSEPFTTFPIHPCHLAANLPVYTTLR